MLKNMNKFRGLVHSQRVLLALTQAGVSREDAYRLVQRNAMKVWEQGADFLEELLADPEVTAALPEAETPGKIRPRLPHQACRHDLPPGVRRRLNRNLASFGSVVVADILIRTAAMADHDATIDPQRRTGSRAGWFAIGALAATWSSALFLFAGDYFRASASADVAAETPALIIEGN